MSKELIERLERGECGNELDVLVEVATFEADDAATACRPNNAGTKVIYTLTNGDERTYTAREWTREPLRTTALTILKAQGAQQ